MTVSQAVVLYKIDYVLKPYRGPEKGRLVCLALSAFFFVAVATLLLSALISRKLVRRKSSAVASSLALACARDGPSSVGWLTWEVGEGEDAPPGSP